MHHTRMHHKRFQHAASQPSPSVCMHWHKVHSRVLACNSHAQHDNPISSGSDIGSTRRQVLLTCSGLAMTAPGASPALAARKAKQEYRDATTLDAATSATDFKEHVDQDRIFTCLVPAGWTSVATVDREAGLLASWYNPNEPGAETLAVYRRAGPDAKDTRGLGTAQDLGTALASVAPNSLLLGFDEYKDDKGKVYYTCCVEFDGSTAGRFGSAIELRTVCAVAGVQYTLRITTTRYRYISFPEVKTELLTVANSLKLLL